MENKMLDHDRLKPYGEKGLHSKLDWLKEAESKRISSLMLREVAKNKQKELSELVENDDTASAIFFERLQLCESARKNSFLLLGYAIELLLKSGVVSLLINAPKWALEKSVKKYSHNLPLLAGHLHIKFCKEEQRLLSDLSSFIVNETRYPVTAPCIQDYCKIVNTLSAKWASDRIFDIGLDIYDKILRVIKSIDGTEDNPKLYSRSELGLDGFVIFRQGGSFPDVFLIKYSTKQIASKNNNLNSIKELIKSKEQVMYKNMLECWNNADFYIVSSEGLKKQNI